MASRLQDVIIRGTRAAQPLATAVSAGTLYYVTDEGITERSDGTNWESFSDTGVVASIVISAGAASGSRNSIVFSNSNGVSFGLNGSTITASHNGLTSQSNQALSAENGSFTFQTAHFSNGSNVSFSTSVGSAVYGIVATSLTNIAFSAGASSALLSSLVFSNSNNVSFGLDGSTVTATVTVATSLTNILVSAGASSTHLSALTFADSNGVSFGLSDGTITASAVGGAGAGVTLNNWQNFNVINDYRSAVYGNNYYVMPMPIPGVLSGQYFRYAASMQSNLNRTFGATSANTSWSAEQVITFHNRLFTRDTGANSSVFNSVSDFSNFMTVRTLFTNGAVGSNWTCTLAITGPFETTVVNTTSNYACTSASYVINTGNFGLYMNGTRWIEIPFNTTLSAGNWFIGFGRSTTTTNNGGATGLSTTNFELCMIGSSYTTAANSRFANSDADSIGPQFGMGIITSNTPQMTRSSFDSLQLQATGAANALFIPFGVI